MSLKINCNLCGKELKRLGALLFSPPSGYKNYQLTVQKYHCCEECWDKIIAESKGEKPMGLRGILHDYGNDVEHLRGEEKVERRNQAEQSIHKLLLTGDHLFNLIPSVCPRTENWDKFKKKVAQAIIEAQEEKLKGNK